MEPREAIEKSSNCIIETQVIYNFWLYWVEDEIKQMNESQSKKKIGDKPSVTFSTQENTATKGLINSSKSLTKCLFVRRGWEGDA